MAGKGFPPRPPENWLELGAAPADAPKLPGRSHYLQATRKWWDTWARSPQASQFTDTEWQRLAMLAPIVDAFHREPSAKLLQIIAREESRFGATVEDRLRLRWFVPGARLEPPTPPKSSRKRARRDDPRLRLVDAADEAE